MVVVGCEQINTFIGATLGDNKLYFHIGVAITAAAAVAWRAREHRPAALAILNMNRYGYNCMYKLLKSFTAYTLYYHWMMLHIIITVLSTSAFKDSKPNIVVLHADDLG